MRKELMRRIKEDLSLLKTAEVNLHLLSLTLRKRKISPSSSFSFPLYNLVRSYKVFSMHTNSNDIKDIYMEVVLWKLLWNYVHQYYNIKTNN